MTAAMCAAAVALGILFFLIKSRVNYLRLPELPVREGSSEYDLSIVIPARNEAANIGRVVSSFPGQAVLVVDDASDDDTAKIAKEAGAFVIPAPALTKGTKGKPNACMAGARASDSRWILFVDADTHYEPRFLQSLMQYARDENLMGASVFLKQECLSLFERMLLPYAFALYFCGVNSRRVNSLTAREFLANGQCMLFRRDAYIFINGHGAVAGSVIEDVELARILKRHRMNVRVLRGEHLGSVRMYSSFGAIWRGFEKNSYRFLTVNPRGGLQVVLASILLTSYVPVLVWLGLTGRWIAAAIFALLPGCLLIPWYRTISAILYAPFAIYLFQLIALNAMLSTLLGRKAVWKGRRV